MRNVKQKFSGCRRAAMLTVLAILLSCLPVGRALAWGVGETVTNTIRDREDATQISMQVELTKVSADGTEMWGKLISMRVYFKPSYTGTEFVYPTSMPDSRDASKTIYITEIQLETCVLYNADRIPATKTVTFPEGITNVVSQNLPEFPQAETLKLSSTIEFIDNVASYYNGSGKILETVGKLNSIVFPEGHSKYRSNNDGILYSGNQLLYIHSNIFKSTETTLTIPEGVESIADHSIGAYSQIETINLPSTYNAAKENYLGGYNTMCTRLQNIFVASGNNDYYDINGVLCRYGTKNGQPYNYLYCYPQAKTATDNSYSVPTDASAGAGKGISEIIGYAFHENNSISSVDLGDVRTLQSYAFHHCRPSGGIELTIPAQLTDIEPDAFNLTTIKKFIVENDNPVYSSDDVGVLFEIDSDNKKVLKEFPQGATVQGNYTIPSDVDIIGIAAFDGCTISGNVIISSNVTTINNSAFSNSNVQGVSFAEGTQVTTIPDNCFEYCQIRSIDLPSTITSIGNAAFKQSLIESIIIPASVTSFGTDAFRKCTQLTSAEFQNSLSALPDFSFEGCTSLTTVTLPSNCTSIGEEAFNNCTELSGVAMPQGLKTIGKYAFKNTKMKDVEFPSTLITIGYAAFMNCSGWTKTLTIPASVSSIEGYAFCNTDVQKVVIKNGSMLTSFEVCVFGSTTAPTSWSTAANTTLKEIKFEGSSRITSIGAYAFNKYQALESFTCPPNVTTIGRSAFEDCTSLKEFVFPPALRYIIMSAFYNTALETIDLSRCTNFDYIGNTAFSHCAVSKIIFADTRLRLDFEAFRDCPNLTEVTLPKFVQTVDGGSFCFCPNLMNYYVDESSTKYSDNLRCFSAVGGYLLTADKEKLVAFPEARADKNFTLLPPSITDIGDYAFYSCGKLENVTIPNKVTNISGVRAFGLCTNLKTITFLCDEMINPSAIEQRSGKQAFDNNSLAGKTIYVRKELKGLYENDSFYSTAENIIPSFEEDAREFTDWESGKRRVVVDGVDTNPNAEVNEYINVSEHVVSMIGTKSKDHTFVLSPSVTHGTETFSVELIGDYAFQNAAADINEVVVMDYIKYIGANAFTTGLAADDPNLTENGSTIERIFFVNTKPNTVYEMEDKLTSMISTVRFKLKAEDLVNGKDYREFLPGQRIFVKKSMLDDYQHYWPEYAEQIDYRIRPLPAATTRATVAPTETKYDFIKIEAGKKYGTFSREFDVDLGQYAKDKASANESIGSFDIKAFTTGAVADGPGDRHDYPEDNDDYTVPYHLRMYHIGYSEGKDGTYIPNATGALLAVMNDWNGTPSDYYYCIGEDDNGGDRNNDNTDVAGNGTLHRSIESATTTLEANPASGNIYHLKKWVMQGGIFRPVKETEIYLPAHKAWLYYEMDYPKDASASAMTFGFSLDSLSEDTGVEGIGQDNATAASGIYTLTGVKVLKPEGKGIYIVNGKKMIIK